MKDQIANYIRAGYSGLFIVSPEETRIEAMMREAIHTANSGIRGNQDKFKLFVWSCTQGLFEVAEDAAPVPDTQDPLPMLDHFEKLDERSVLLCRDLHPFLEDRNPLLWRKLREVIFAAKAKTKSIVIVGCRFVLPPELEREVTVVEFKLPDRDQLRVVMEGLVTGNDAAMPANSDEILAAASGMTTSEAEAAFGLSIIEHNEITPEVVFREKCAAIKKSGLLEVYDPKGLTLDDIGGLDNLKEWLMQIRHGFSDEAREFGAPVPRGALVVGQPGTGKSETAKACKAVFGKPLLKLDAGRLFGSLVGQTEQNWRLTYSLAKAMAPCILWIDEIDGLGGGSGGDQDGGTTARVVKSILQSMDESSGIFFFATANDIDKIPAPLIRRFDQLWNVELPNDVEREAIWGIQIGRVRRKPAKFDLRKLAEASKGFSGHEIQKIMGEVMHSAFTNSRKEPTTEAVIALAKGFTPLSETMAAEIERRRLRLKGVARDASRPIAAAAPSVGESKRKVVSFNPGRS